MLKVKHWEIKILSGDFIKGARVIARMGEINPQTISRVVRQDHETGELYITFEGIYYFQSDFAEAERERGTHGKQESLPNCV